MRRCSGPDTYPEARLPRVVETTAGGTRCRPPAVCRRRAFRRSRRRQLSRGLLSAAASSCNSVETEIRAERGLADHAKLVVLAALRVLDEHRGLVAVTAFRRRIGTEVDHAASEGLVALNGRERVPDRGPVGGERIVAEGQIRPPPAPSSRSARDPRLARSRDRVSGRRSARWSSSRRPGRSGPDRRRRTRRGRTPP